MEKLSAFDLRSLLDRALEPRLSLLNDDWSSACRLFNGFTEGYPSLVVEFYGHTLVIFTHKLAELESQRLADDVSYFYRDALKGIECAVLKQRSSRDQAKKSGQVLFGSDPDTSILENGVTYALDLLMNQDAGFYVDTRNLRAWLKEHSTGKSVLNTFAYTGSLGVAALAGGARQVMQIDRSGKFLALAQRSAALNGMDVSRMTSKAVDFFVGVAQMKRNRQSFDTVILDPPFFSITEHGRVDQVNEATRLINKARPLVKDGGRLIVVNNALFLSGKEFIDALEALGRDGYLRIEEIIPIPQDVTGYETTRVGRLPADPAPFNHSTKIAVLQISRKMD